MKAAALGSMIGDYILSMTGVKSPATVKWYASRLKSLAVFIGADRDVTSITIADLRKWRAALNGKATRFEDHPTRPTESGGLASETFRGYVRAVRIFFRWLVAEDVLSKNPADRLELPPRSKLPRKGIEAGDMQHIIEAAHSPHGYAYNQARDYALTLFMADTACRAGGIYNLKVADLDLPNRRATVTEKGLGGNGLPRAVFLEPDTVKAVQAWLDQRPADWPDADYVFNTPKGSLTYSGVYLVIKRLAKHAEVTTGWNPHNWRHGAARAMLNNGASLAHVQQILGHADVSTTARFYGTFATRELQDAHDRYSWRAQGDPDRTQETTRNQTHC